MAIAMDEVRNNYGFVLILSLIIALGVVSSALCIASEFKKAKRKDLEFDEKLCYLPGSQVFGFGISALVCLLVAQIIGNLIICSKLCSGEKRINCCKAKKPTVVSTFLFLSWISFGIAVVLLSTATSMNAKQPYGEGWLDSECYLVKDGVFFGSAILVLVCVGSTVSSAIITSRKRKVELGQKVHAQVG